MSLPNIVQSNMYAPVRVTSRRDRERRALAVDGTDTGRVISLAMPHQGQSEWCWAAVSACLKNFHDGVSTHTPCSIATSVLRLERDESQLDCCADNASCNEQCGLRPALRHIGLSARQMMHPEDLPQLSPDELRNELSLAPNGHPIACGIRIGALTHYVVVKGVLAENGADTVIVEDPLHGFWSGLYDAFCNNYRDIGVWKETFFIRPD